jgi:hypothetical protein
MAILISVIVSYFSEFCPRHLRLDRSLNNNIRSLYSLRSISNILYHSLAKLQSRLQTQLNTPLTRTSSIKQLPPPTNTTPDPTLLLLDQNPNNISRSRENSLYVSDDDESKSVDGEVDVYVKAKPTLEELKKAEEMAGFSEQFHVENELVSGDGSAEVSVIYRGMFYKRGKE